MNYFELMKDMLYTEKKCMMHGQYNNYWVEKKLEKISSELRDNDRRISAVNKAVLSMQDPSAIARDRKELEANL